MTHESRKHLATAFLATLAVLISSCAWWQAHPDVGRTADAVLANGERICVAVTDDAGKEREVCSDVVEIARRADVLAKLILTDATAAAPSCPVPLVAPVAVPVADPPQPAPSASGAVP
jgi:hypothetical protein